MPNDDTRPSEAEDLPYCYADEGDEPLTSQEKTGLLLPALLLTAICGVIASCMGVFK